MRAFERSILVGIGLALTLGGCSSVIEQIPASMGGLPAGTPARPATPYEYPAVHDMPPPRATTPLTEEQQFKLEADLQAARDSQEGRSGAGKKAAPKPKNNANGTKNRENSGGNAGARTNP